MECFVAFSFCIIYYVYSIILLTQYGLAAFSIIPNPLILAPLLRRRVPSIERSYEALCVHFEG